MSEGLDAALAQIHEAPPGGLGPAQYQALSRKLSSETGALQSLRLVLLSTYTTDLFTPFLRVEGARHGFMVDAWHGGFGQLEQAVLGEAWRAPEGTPEALVLAMRLEDLEPDAVVRLRADRDAFDTLAQDALTRIGTILEQFRSRSTGPAFVANFALPWPRPLGVFDAGDPASLTHRVHTLNRALLEVLSDHPSTFVWDYAGLVSSRGEEGWTDPRLWSLARAPVAAAHQPALGAHMMRTLAGALRPTAKCVVVDLDETLWGGVVGDDGLRGIRLGDDHPGNAFKAFQRALLALRDRGVLLAVCSRNDEDVAREAIETHPEMLLRWDDFSAARINWNRKGQNLREIAEELNIGLDSLVFFDDNPVEREEVRQTVPEVHVVEVPTDPTGYVRALADTAALDAPVVTDDDLQRADFYASQAARTAAAAEQSPEAFLHSLDMRATMGELDPSTSMRISQLVGKTNQYNLTTIRYTQSELEKLADAPDSAVWWIRLEDRYGDLGLVCVGVLRTEDRAATIDSLVLSCRAANRGLEQAMVSHLASVAAERGCTSLIGLYAPTPRNSVVRELYDRLGFDLSSEDSSGRQYHLELSERSIDPPDFLAVAVGQEA